MKILLAHYKIQDYGGIVNYSEYLARGLKAQGHEVDSVMLRNKGKTGFPKEVDRELDTGWEYGEGLGLWMHQRNGWQGMYQINYLTDMNEWNALSDGVDLIIYIIPVPTRSKEYKEDEEWVSLYDQFSTTQLLVVHDGNMQKLYPHINEILPNIDGVICVHDAAFNSCEVLEAPRLLVPNPHAVPEYLNPIPIKGRVDGLFSLQTFKRWKRVDDLVRAIEHLPREYEKLMAGGGIEYHYMTSKTKVKPEYLKADGSRIWDNAVANGMEWYGYITTEERDTILRQVKLLVDPSWSKSYSELGAHFNRVMVEAMVQGTVPVCTDLGMKNSSFFKAGINYIEIPYDSTPEQYAAILQDAIEDVDLLQQIQDNNKELLKTFACESVADMIVEFATDIDFVDASVGKATSKFLKDAKAKMEYFYEL